MEKEVPLYKMIYLKLVNRILVGLYPKGYQFSSVEKIHDLYGIGYTSIRKAMKMLQESGYIRLEERKRPTVIFDANDPECIKLRRRVFLSHCKAHLDCYQAIPCIIPVLVLLGAEKRTPQLTEALEDLCSQDPSHFRCRTDLLTLVYTWQALVVRQSGNEIAMDLFLQIRGFDDLRFIAMPSEALMPGEAETALLYLRHWTDLLRRGQLNDLYTLILLFCRQALCSLERSFAPLKSDPELEDVRQLDFRWYIRQNLVPMYRSIARDLMRMAYLENLQPGECFPSESVLMTRYGVAAVTVRGALALLNELGVAQTVNGVGTIFTGCYSGNCESRDYITECRESADILAFCGRSFAGAALPFITKEQIGRLLENAQQYRCREGIILWLMRELTALIPSDALQNIFDSLETRCIFAMYTNGMPAEKRRQNAQDDYTRVIECLMHLEAGHTDIFVEKFDRVCRSLSCQAHACFTSPKT